MANAAGGDSLTAGSSDAAETRKIPWSTVDRLAKKKAVSAGKGEPLAAAAVPQE